jgi:hypothetical protein
MIPLIVCKVEQLDFNLDLMGEEVKDYRAAIDAALKQVNGVAVRRAITSYSDVVDIARRTEKRLAKQGVSERNRAGTIVTYRPPVPAAKAHKHAVKVTRIMLQRNTSSWLLAGAEKTEIWPKTGEGYNIRITEAAAVNIMSVALSDFTIVGPAAVMRDLVLFGRGQYHVAAYCTHLDVYKAVEENPQIVGNGVCITAIEFGNGEQRHQFALFARDPKALERAMVMARLTHAETLRFGPVMDPAQEPE